MNTFMSLEPTLPHMLRRLLETVRPGRDPGRCAGCGATVEDGEGRLVRDGGGAVHLQRCPECGRTHRVRGGDAFEYA
jgi:hypothetical protein